MSETSRPLKALIALSGLTPTQIGRLFGVPARTVQNWAAGTPAPDRHAVRLGHLTSEISALGDTPEERRAVLLFSASGPSRYRQLLEQVDEPAVIQVQAGTVLGRLGV